MTRTITVYFDTSDPTNLGYAAQMDVPCRPGVADGPAVSLGRAGAARRCATGPKPPARVQRAARVTLGLGDARITWERLDTGDGWTGTCGAAEATRMIVQGRDSFTVDVDFDGIPFCDDLCGGVYRLSPRGQRYAMWSRSPSRTCARFAAQHTRGMGEWRT